MSHPAIHLALDVRRGTFSMRADLTLPGRGVTALFGHSGSGKTSLLRAIAGLERHAGRLEVNGELWQDDGNHVFMPTHQRPIGYVFQEPSLLPHLTVAGNLAFGLRRIASENRRIDKQTLLQLLGIEHLLERRPAGLSGGERQRVAIARALLTSPRLLLMDEPLAALDHARKQEVLPYLERIRDELDMPMLYVTHAPEEVARLADHMVLLDAGRILASGAIADITSRLDLPTALADGAGTVAEATAMSYDRRYQLLTVRVAGNLIYLAHAEVPVGTRMRLRILALDVSLSLGRQEDSSILNQLPAQIVAEVPGALDAQVVMRLNASGMPLLARITRHSRDRLHVAPGSSVWAQFKAVAVRS
ncbi:MAG: molybdenum ABC transporter ATP-binding protein [Pseudomonadota bacterium]